MVMSQSSVTVPKIAGSVTEPAHDEVMAADFLATLDPTASKFTFQFFNDSGERYAEVFHGSLKELWPKVLALNTPLRGVGVFVAISETDLQGRKSKNILGPRALFVDADSLEQSSRCIQIARATGATPTMAVQTSAERCHLYYCCPDIPREGFSAYQTAMSARFGTDPAVKDLPRVMRLPGTLQLKNPSSPQKVTLKRPTNPRGWRIGELTTALDLLLPPTVGPQSTRSYDPGAVTPAGNSAGRSSPSGRGIHPVRRRAAPASI
jgi:hypothetical protein